MDKRLITAIESARKRIVDWEAYKKQLINRYSSTRYHRHLYSPNKFY
ncbi:hypothetical protein [Candidatus Walczuchella monophlebidarum]|nr:hypothetical protein [Candidatus Walczuchella monophlebidarum]